MCLWRQFLGKKGEGSLRCHPYCFARAVSDSGSANPGSYKTVQLKSDQVFTSNSQNDWLTLILVHNSEKVFAASCCDNSM